MPNDAKPAKLTTAELAGRLDAALARIEALEDRVHLLESWTPEARRLTLDDVAAIVAGDRYAEFECLADWQAGTRRFTAGQVVRADGYPHLLDYVRSGLALAVPADVGERVREAQSLAQAQRELAQAEAALARSRLASAQAQVLESLDPGSAAVG